MKISNKTVIKYFKIFRELCIKDLNFDNLQIGGPGVIVEIDESLMAKVKHHKGKDLKRKQIWVFGMKERGICLSFCERLFFLKLKSSRK